MKNVTKHSAMKEETETTGVNKHHQALSSSHSCSPFSVFSLSSSTSSSLSSSSSSQSSRSPLRVNNSSSSSTSSSSAAAAAAAAQVLTSIKQATVTCYGFNLYRLKVLLLLTCVISVCQFHVQPALALSILSHPVSKFRDAISGYSVDLNEDEANKLVKSKMSLYSSSLNILDSPPEDTQLAHSVLLIQKKKPPTVHSFKPISLSLKMSTSPQSAVSSSSTSSSSHSPSHSSAYLSSLVNYSHTGAFTVNSKNRSRASTTSTTTPATSVQASAAETNPLLNSVNRGEEIVSSSLSHAVHSSAHTMSSSSSTTTTTDRSVNKISAHTLKPFPVYSSLNYGIKPRPAMIFRNITQVNTADKEKDALLKKQAESSSTVISNHRPSPSPHRQSQQSATTLNPIDSFIQPTAASSTPFNRRKPSFSSFSSENNEDEDRPVIVHSNHQKPFLGRLKLTSIDYNDQHWSTPLSFTEVPKVSTTTPSPMLLRLSTPTSMMSIASRPPLKVASVHSNRQKLPDKIQSSQVTVMDRPGDNVTIMHQKLIVKYKNGRPKPGVSSVGTILSALTTAIRPKPPSSSEVPQSESVTPNSNDVPEVSTYYPRPSAWTAEPPIPDSCIGCDVTYPSVHLPMISSTTSTTPSTTPSTSSTTMAYDNHGAESSHVYVTRRPPYPVATVNAILAPPMPSRPISTPAPLGNTGIFQSLLGVIGADSTGGLMSRLTLLKTALFTLLVMALPPLALIASLL